MNTQICRAARVKDFLELLREYDKRNIARKVSNPDLPTSNLQPLTTKLYSYRDEEGRPLFKVIRIEESGEEKGVNQYKAGGNGRFKNNPGSFRLVLYRLPELLAAIKRGERRVFIVGRERCAESLWARGLVATTNPGGTGTWREEYSKFFSRDLEIIIIPESDLPGQKHAQMVAKTFLSQENVTKILNLNYPITLDCGKDITDWFGEGHTKEELLSMVEKTNPYGYNLEEGMDSIELLRMEFPEPGWIIPEIITEGLTLLAGKPKIGKSWFALQLAIATASGGMIFGKRVEQGKVAYLALEDTLRRLQGRLKRLNPGEEVKGIRFFTHWEQESAIFALRALLRTHKDIKLVIIDTLQRFRPGRHWGNSYQDDYQSLSSIKEVANEFRVSIVVLHHLRKAESADPFETISGTTGICGSADTLLVLQKGRGRVEAILHSTGRDIEERELALKFEPTCAWTLLGSMEEYRQSKERVEILQVLKEADESMTPKEIAEVICKKPNTVAQILRRMAGEKILEKKDHGKYSLSYSLL